MPSVSGPQHRFMAMVANNPQAAQRAGVPQSVGADFMRADKGKKFSKEKALAHALRKHPAGEREPDADMGREASER
jgi:hypothetical protein